jgi:hypothetical protein
MTSDDVIICSDGFSDKLAQLAKRRFSGTKKVSASVVQIWEGSFTFHCSNCRTEILPTKYTCSVCGGSSLKFVVNAVVIVDDGTFRTKVRICEEKILWQVLNVSSM